MPKSSAPTISVWGELLWDLFPDGAQLGGAPANVAYHLAQMGAPVALIGRVGDDDRGHEARRRLAARGVDVGCVQQDGDRATGEVEIHVVGGEPRYRLVPGRAWERIACDDAARACVASAAAIVYGTLAQITDEGLASWRAMIEACGATTLRVCDPNLRPGAVDARALAAALEVADVIKLNDLERRLIGETLGWNDPVAHLIDRGARVVAITHGARGATLITRDGSIAIAGAPSTPGGDNVGCGDAFVAGLTRGLVRGDALAEIGAVAARWAAAVASHRGATPDFSSDRIAAMLAAP